MRRLAASLLARFVRLVLRLTSRSTKEPTLARIRQLAARLVASASAFLRPVGGSIKGIVTTEEFVRSLLTAIGSGSAVSVALLVLSALSANVALIAPNPAVAAVLSFGLVHAADLLRRLYHVAPTPAKADPVVAEFLARPPGSVA